MAPSGYRGVALTEQARDDLGAMTRLLSQVLGRPLTLSSAVRIAAQLVEDTPEPELRSAARNVHQ